MSALLFRFTCDKCGDQFDAPGTVDFAYGEFVMRSESGEYSVFLNALGDPVFREVSDVVDSDPKLQAADEKMMGDLTQKVFSVACDLAPDGSRYQMGRLPRCPRCGGDTLKGWHQVIPPITVELPSPTHREWLSLSTDERKRLIKSAAEEIVLRDSRTA